MHQLNLSIYLQLISVLQYPFTLVISMHKWNVENNHVREILVVSYNIMGSAVLYQEYQCYQAVPNNEM